MEEVRNDSPAVDQVARKVFSRLSTTGLRHAINTNAPWRSLCGHVMGQYEDMILADASAIKCKLCRKKLGMMNVGELDSEIQTRTEMDCDVCATNKEHGVAGFPAYGRAGLVWICQQCLERARVQLDAHLVGE